MSEHEKPEAPGRQVAATQAVRVTFFEDRAEIVRKARCRVGRGVSWVALSGISAVADDPSVVAGIKSPTARVIAARVVRRVREEPQLSPGEVAQAEAAERAARRQREAAERALERAQGLLARCVGIGDTWFSTVQQVPRGERGQEWRPAYGAISQAQREALDQVSRCQQELVQRREEEARAGLRLSEGRRLVPRHETLVMVQVEARGDEEVEVDLTYRTPCALWRPEHLMQLVTRKDGQHELVIRTLATVWQHTGEEWRGVQCRFSTARPAQSASPPLLTDDVLVARKKSIEERRVVVVEAREQAVAVAGLGRGVRAVEEMPGVEDGGEPLWFQAAQPANLLSDGQPHRVEIGEARLSCEMDLIAYPERSEAVFVRATATLRGDTPLLAGPVRLLRGSEMVGSGRVGFVGRGEPFEIGFGVDDGLRVRRQVEEQRESTLLGGQRVVRTVRVYLSNLSGAPRRLTVTERLPVSEIEDLKVTLGSLSGAPAKHDERDGFVRFDAALDGRATRELSLSYRLEAGGKVQLPTTF